MEKLLRGNLCEACIRGIYDAYVREGMYEGYSPLLRIAVKVKIRGLVSNGVVAGPARTYFSAFRTALCVARLVWVDAEFHRGARARPADASRTARHTR